MHTMLHFVTAHSLARSRIKNIRFCCDWVACMRACRLVFVFVISTALWRFPFDSDLEFSIIKWHFCFCYDFMSPETFRKKYREPSTKLWVTHTTEIDMPYSWSLFRQQTKQNNTPKSHENGTIHLGNIVAAFTKFQSNFR